VTLGELTASSTRLALVGLAKNTGKTETLAALLRELSSDTARRRVGVTSIGRDGERHDVIDARIEKPRIQLPGGSLLATTDVLLRASGLPHELLEQTGIRTPLGEVLIARLRGAGAVEVAGPSAAAEVRAVSDAMLDHGAEQVLIDGAIDRRAASSPDVADGLIVATGAVLSHELAEVVSQTRDAVELIRLPRLDDSEGEGRPRALAADAARRHREGATAGDLLVDDDGEHESLPPGFVLTAGADRILALLDGRPRTRWLIVAGALPSGFLGGLSHAARRRRRRLVVVVADPTKVFLAGRGPSWYRQQGVEIRVLAATELQAVTVNPVAPQSHRFDSSELRRLLRETLDDELPILDVLDPD
jgi:hypothetical protein